MMNSSFLSNRSKEILLGSLLGDGSLRIHTGYKNARFSFRHSIKQKDYFFWKANELKEISGNSYFWKQKPDGFGFGGEKLRYQSLALSQLTNLYHLTHERDKLIARPEWLKLLTPLSLAVWWLDDGSLTVNSRRGVICTDSFPYEFQQTLADYLDETWGIKVKIGKITRIWKGKTREYFRLWIRSGEELKKLLRLVLPHIQVESMLPKVLLLYRNPELQQRWISEVSMSTGFSEKVVRKYVNEKKSRWKYFRK